MREASIQEKACSGTGNLGKLFTFISYILAWTVSKRHWLLQQSIGTTALENEAYTTIWTILIVALFLLIVGPILACKLYKKIITTLHPSYQIVEEEIKTEKAQRTKEKCCSKSSCCPKSSYEEGVEEAELNMSDGGKEIKDTTKPCITLIQVFLRLARIS